MGIGRLARRYSLAGLALAGALLSGCDRAEPVGAKVKPRKIFLIVVDSLRYDHLDAFGYEKETAPYIAQLVEESVVFDLAISPSNYTGVSVPAYFTGKPLSNIFAYHPVPVRIPEEETTLAESLSDAGYTSHLWGANTHLSYKGFEQGFDHMFSGHLKNPTTALVSIEGLIREIENSYEATRGRELHYIHTMDVHFPYHPPHPYETMFAEEEYPGGATATGQPLDPSGNLVWSNLPYYAENHFVDDTDIAHLIALYDATIRYTDDYLPELLDSLGYDPDQDMLILTADHGEQLFTHGWAAHTAMLLMQEIHVPLIVKAPGYAPRRVSGPVSLMDLYPTVCDMLGLETPEGLTGKSLVPAMNGESEGGEIAYSETYHLYGLGATLVTRDRLYYFRANQSVQRPWELWPILTELYDIENDPNCLVNLLTDGPAPAREYHEDLLKRFPQWSGFGWEALRAPAGGPELGSNEFTAWTTRHVVNGETDLDAVTLESGVTLNEAQPELQAEAVLSEPGGIYAVSFRYKVESGTARFELIDADTKRSLWSYHVVKPSIDETPLSVRVDILGERVEFRAQVDDQGATHFGGLELRRLHVPKIQPVAVGSATADVDDSEGDVLTDSEKDALEAIGYIQ